MKFYKTTFSIDVLSEEPLGDCLSLSQIDYAISEGDCVGTNLRAEQTELICPKKPLMPSTRRAVHQASSAWMTTATRLKSESFHNAMLRQGIRKHLMLQ